MFFGLIQSTLRITRRLPLPRLHTRRNDLRNIEERSYLKILLSREFRRGPRREWMNCGSIQASVDRVKIALTMSFAHTFIWYSFFSVIPRSPYVCVVRRWIYEDIRENYIIPLLHLTNAQCFEKLIYDGHCDISGTRHWLNLIYSLSIYFPGKKACGLPQ